MNPIPKRKRGINYRFFPSVLSLYMRSKTRFGLFPGILLSAALVVFCHANIRQAAAGPVIGFGLAGGSLLYDGNFEQTTGFPCEPGTPVSFSALLQVEFIRPLPLRLSVSSSRDEVSTVFNDESAGVDFTDTEIGLLAMYRFFDPPLSPVSLHLGGGFGCRLLTTEPVGSSIPDGFADAMIKNEILWGLKGVGGLEIEIPALRSSIFMEGYFHYVYTSGNPVKFPEYSAGWMFRF